MRVLHALHPRRRTSWCFALLCVLATTVALAQSRDDNSPAPSSSTGPASVVPDEPHDYEPIALAEVTAREGLDPNTVILASLDSRLLPTLGQTIFLGKALDLQTGLRYAVALDVDGNPIDGDALLAQEREAYRATYGRVHELLHPMLVEAKTHDVIDIAIWLKTGEIQIPEREPFSSDRKSPSPRPNHPPRDGSEPESRDDATASEEHESEENPQDALRREASAMLAAQMVPVQAPVLAALEEYGLTPSYVSPIAPLIYVSAPKWVILELAERGDVDTLYGPNENRDFNDIAKPTQKADIADFWNFEGSGIDVGILEDSRVEFANPNLVSGTTRVPGDSNVDDHATSTCGMVASQHLTHGGMAQLATMFSANATDYSDSNLAAALDWAASTQNLDVINNSWGGNVSSTSLNDHDRHCDYIVRNLWSTVTVAAGNDANGCQADTDIVGSPGKGYNVITVGGYNDQGTVTWDDDTVYNCSSFLDPSTGCEKPEVAASGANITSTTASAPWNGWVGSGTSYAAPMVSGLAANLMQSNGSLQVYPELTKALIMATAIHNIEGASRLSEVDGAGAIDMRAGVFASEESTTDWRSVNSSTTFPYTITHFVHAGERVRAVISWDSNPSSDYSTDPLQADFDLTADTPSGTFASTSSSGPNPFEVLDFIATETGSYTFEVSKWSMTSTTEYIGFAVWSGSERLNPDVTRLKDAPPVVEDTIAVDLESFWNVVAMKPLGTSDYDLIYNDNSPWEDPADYDNALGPFVGGSGLELMLTDRNHASIDDDYVSVRSWSGSDDYLVQHATHSGDLGNGEFGPYTMGDFDLAMTFDTSIGMTPRGLRVVPTSGTIDLGLYLFDSEPGDDDSHRQHISDNVANTDTGGPGEEESLIHSTATQDWHGFVVVNRDPSNGSTATEFMIYSDTSAPTGSISINGGTSQTGGTRVDVTIDVSDPQTGIWQYRYRDAAGLWSSWTDAGGFDDLDEVIRVDLLGSGTRTFQVEVQNRAGLTSAFSDTIFVYSCPQPAGSLTNGNFADQTGFPWCFVDDATDGFVDYPGSSAVVYGPNDGGAAQSTYITQTVNLVQTGTHLLTFDWEYGSGNSADFDYAFYDVVNTATGTSVLGGPQTLSGTPGATGSLSQPITGPATVEIRLGTGSTDSVFGFGFSTFSNVAVAYDQCMPVTDFTCSSESGGVQLNWSNAEPYQTIWIHRDGVQIAAFVSPATSFFDSSATPGAHLYEVEAFCTGGVSSGLVGCSVNHECLAVSNLNCTPNASSVDLSWVNQDAYTSISIARNGTTVATLSGSATAFNDSGLGSGSYTYEVTAQCGSLVASATSCVTTIECAPVTGLFCTEISGQAALSWTNGESYSAVTIVRNGTVVASLPGTATSFIDPVQGTHTYEVIGDCGSSSASAEVCTVTVECTAPNSLSCSVSGSTVTLDWNNTSPYTQIEVFRNGVSLSTLAGDAMNLVDTAAPAGAVNYEVFAECSTGTTLPALSCTVSVECAPVTGLTCGPVGGMLLTWTNGETYTAVTVVRNGVTIATLDGSATAYSDSTPGFGTITYEVIGTCTGGIDAAPAACTVTVGCDAVSGLTCNPFGSDVDLAWTNEESYASITVLRDGSAVATLSGSATSYTDTGVPAGSHTYTVSASCSGGIASDATCAVNLACSSVVALDCTEVGTGAVQLDWINSASYSSVIVRRNGVILATLGGAVTSYLDVSPPAGAVDYEVAGVCPGGVESAPTACSLGLCASVTGLTCVETGGDVQLQWVNGTSYSEIRVYRNGLLISTLGGGSTMVFDLGVPAGTYTYEVEGDCSGAVSSATCSVTIGTSGETFIRGDCNTDGSVEISDVVYGLAFLFSGGDASTCEDACDVNDDGSIEISDMVYQLAALFSGGSAPPAPFGACGSDPTTDSLGCDSNPGCP